jgi:hypothetical protein
VRGGAGGMLLPFPAGDEGGSGDCPSPGMSCS